MNLNYPLRQTWRNDYLVTLLSNILLSGMGLLTGIITAKLLGPHGRGSLGAIVVWTNMIGSIGVIGIPHAITYYSGRGTAGRSLLWRTSIFLASVQGMTLSIGSAAALPLILRNLEPAARDETIWFSFFIVLSLLQGYQLALLQGAGRFRSWNLLRLFSSAAHLVLLLVFSIGGLTLRGALLAQMGSMALTTLAVSYLCYKIWGGEHPKLEAPLLRQLFGFGIPTALAGLSYLVSSQLDQILLTQLVGPTELGLYVVAVGLSWGILPASQAVSVVAYSHMAQAREQGGQTRITRRSLALTFWLLLAGGVSGALLAEPLIVLLYGQSYKAAVGPFRILVLAIPFLGGNQILGNLLRGTGRPLFAGLCELMGAILTVALLIILLPSYGITGAAIASLAAYAIVFILLLSGLSRTLMQPVSLLLRPLPLRRAMERT